MYLDLQSIFFQEEQQVIAIYFRTRKAPKSMQRTHRGEHKSLRSKTEVQAEVDRAKLKYEKTGLSLLSHITQRPSLLRILKI